jgi:hypothetical protein
MPAGQSEQLQQGARLAQPPRRIRHDVLPNSNLKAPKQINLERRRLPFPFHTTGPSNLNYSLTA